MRELIQTGRKLPLADLAHPNANRLAYGEDADLPMTLVFEHQSKSFMILVR